MRNPKEIANEIFADGGRLRDYNVQSKLKIYEEAFAEKVASELAKIEIKHLQRQSKGA